MSSAAVVIGAFRVNTFAGRMANIVDHDQTAPVKVVSSVCTMYWQTSQCHISVTGMAIAT